MLLQLRSQATPQEVDAVRALAGELGYEARPAGGDGRLLELGIGRDDTSVAREKHRSMFEDLSAVQAIVDSKDAPELADRTGARPATVVRAGEAVFGGGSFSVIAGPCAVEDAGRLLEIAGAVRAAGAVLLRGGAYKPRTSPHSFQGLGERGLAMLADVKRQVGIGVVTELMDPREVERVVAVADMIQIGSRSMANSPLLVEAGRSGKPVLIKRGMAATAREFLLAAEYVLNEGNDQVVLCERGVRGFDRVTRNVLDVGTIAHLKTATHLPVIVDPSHAAGRSDLILPLAKAGVAAGADGVLVEVHPEPSEVHSDGAQALSIAAFGDLVACLRGYVALEGKRLVAPDASADLALA